LKEVGLKNYIHQKYRDRVTALICHFNVYNNQHGPKF